MSSPVQSPPTFLEAKKAGQVLQAAIKDPTKPLTIADAATASGLPLRDADRGLHWLTSEYRGHLRVTESGELLFLFPTGFTKPWQTKDAVDRALSAIGSAALGVGRFVVRAWVMVVLLAYVALFLAIAIGLMFANQNDRNRRSGFPGGALALTLLRVLADAAFWMFHPFSPFSYGYYGGYGYGYDAMPAASRARAPRGRANETPFYEKVNRFFFGPTPPKEDPHAMQQAILAELRAQKGRIGLSDVMRVTGLPRDQADPMMARLMLDYDGDVDVSEDGGITYHFEAMRRTVEAEEPGRAAVGMGPSAAARPRPAWEKKKSLLPLTGNDGGTNALIVALNTFNLVMSLVAIDNNLTLAKLPLMFGRIPLDHLPYMGTPIALGVVPLVFSVALFALPIARAIARPFQAKKVAEENGRLSVLKEVLTRIDAKAPLTDKALTDAWTRGAGSPPASKELTKRVVELGGDAEIVENTGEVRYRFVDLETEAAALEAEREAASDEEKKVGRVIFASDN